MPLGYCSKCHSINELIDIHESGIILKNSICPTCNGMAIAIEALFDFLLNHDSANEYTVVSDDGTIIPLLSCNVFHTGRWTPDEFDQLECSSDPISTALDISDKYITP